MTDEKKLLPLSDYRPAPPLGDPAYEKVLHSKPGTVHAFTSSRAEEIITNALNEGVAVNHLVASLALRQKQCSHRQILVDTTHRALECETCGAEVDAFDEICLIADGSRKLFQDLLDRDSLALEIKNLERKREELRMEVTKAKAQRNAARRAREKHERASDSERYVLGLWRNCYDARQRGDYSEARRLGALLEKQRKATVDDGEESL